MAMVIGGGNVTEDEKRAMDFVEEIRKIMNRPEGEKPKDQAKLKEFRARHRLMVSQEIAALIEKYNLPPDTKLNFNSR